MHRLKAHTPADRPSIPASGSRRRRVGIAGQGPVAGAFNLESPTTQTLFPSQRTPPASGMIAVNRRAQHLSRLPRRFQEQNPNIRHFFSSDAPCTAGVMPNPLSMQTLRSLMPAPPTVFSSATWKTGCLPRGQRGGNVSRRHAQRPCRRKRAAQAQKTEDVRIENSR